MLKLGTLVPLDYNPDDWMYLCDSIGRLYWYARGDFHTPPEVADEGTDCSGEVCVKAAEGARRGLIQLTTEKTDVNSEWLREYSTKILDPNDYRAGDLVCYPHHVGWLLRPRGKLAPMAILHCGGTGTTRGNVATACVQVRPANYRADFLGVFRPYSSVWRYADGRVQK